MYTSHFQFNAKPFEICTEPRFLWLGVQHKEALAILEYGIQEEKGIIVLSGGVGTGKTTLINTLMSRIKDDVIAAVVSDPGLEPMDFFYYIANLFGITNKVKSKADFLFHFGAFLKKASQQKKKVLLIIDEAQRIKADLLEEIRLLSNIEQSGERLLNVFLIGQNELNEMLLKSENRGLKQRITTFFNIVPLKLDEVHAYIGYRLRVVGCDQKIFTEAAIRKIFNFSKGYPRLINVICDQSLISAFVEDSQKVTAGMVASSAKDLQYPHKTPSTSSISNDGVSTRLVKTLALPFVRSKHQKGKKGDPAINGHVKNIFSSFRLAFIGLTLALLIFSGYLIYQYGLGSTQLSAEALKEGGPKKTLTVTGEIPPLEIGQPNLTPVRHVETVNIPEQKDGERTDNNDAELQRKRVQTSTSPKKPVIQTAITDTPTVIEDSRRKASEYTGRVIMPTISPGSPPSEKAIGEPNAQSVTPSNHREDPGTMISDSQDAADLPAADSSQPPLSNDKDPGAIIDWLIQNNK